MSPVDIIPLSDARVAAPPASSVTLTDAERRELEAAASGYENGAEKIVYRSPPRRRRAVALRGPLARAGGQTSGQDPLGQSQSAPENTPACDAQEPANRAVTLTDAEREVLITVRDIYSSAGDDSCDHIAATIDGLLTRAAKEGER
jgi:DNA-binding CsgD family transcriptional regulator